MTDAPKGRTLSRRQALLAGAGAVGVLSLGPLVLAPAYRFVEKTVTRSIPALSMQPKELRIFATNFIDNYPGTSPRKKKILYLFLRYHHSYGKFGIGEHYPTKIRRPLKVFESDILTAFMLGTDFLDETRDAAAPVTFLFFPDPYAVPCTNRLANFSFDEA